MTSLIPPTEQDPPQPIELFKPDRRWWVLRCQSHDTALHHRRRSEVILAYVHCHVDIGVELYIRRQTRPEGGPGACDKTESKFALKHQDADAGERSVG